MRELSYLPLPAAFFAFLVGAAVIVLLLLQIGVLRYAYHRIGLSAGSALLVLTASLVGSYFNVPVAEWPGHQVIIPFFGMQYVVPVVYGGAGTLLALNVGGAIIPSAISFYLIVRNGLWLRGVLAIAVVAFVTHQLAQPVQRLGIALPVFVPALATASAAMVLSPRHAAPLAYIGGSVGTLIGADLLNLDKIGNMGASVASIGGAGTFDGIFLTGSPTLRSRFPNEIPIGSTAFRSRTATASKAIFRVPHSCGKRTMTTTLTTASDADEIPLEFLIGHHQQGGWFVVETHGLAGGLFRSELEAFKFLAGDFQMRAKRIEVVEQIMDPFAATCKEVFSITGRASRVGTLVPAKAGAN